ncbi:MAG: hypothetical protein HY034_03015 [Nitrospirae bacterium]|nr:hypothetical protein [Nitrospirota bacterium]
MKRSYTISLILMFIALLLSYDAAFAANGSEFVAKEVVIEDLAQTLARWFVWFIMYTFVLVTWVLYALVVFLHLARPYILQILNKFTLRLGADLWWTFYLTGRDIVAVAVFAMGLFNLIPGYLSEIHGLVPWPMIVGPIILGISIFMKSLVDVDDNPAAFKIYNLLILAGFGVYSLGIYGIVH